MRRNHIPRTLAVLVAATVPSAALGQPSAATISGGNIVVVQNDAANNDTSITLTSPNAFNGFQVLSGVGSGSSRGDYNIQIGASTANNFQNGVLITSVRQNGRNNDAFGDTVGLQYGTSAVERSGSAPTADGLQISAFRAPNGAEFNFNTAAAYFPYSGGWVGGHARNVSNGNGGAIAAADSSFAPGVNLGTQFVDGGNGTFTVNLAGVTGVPANASQNGLLLVAGGKNEDNYSLSQANANGTFTVFNRDNGASGTGTEQDGVTFVYVPAGMAGVIAGRVRGDATTVAGVGSGTFTVTADGTGAVLLQIPGATSEHAGVLLVSPEGGETLNFDNIVSYEWDAARTGWVVHTRDIIDTTQLPILEAVGGEAMFSFVFVPVPEPTTVLGVAAATGLGRMWVRRRVWAWRAA